MRLSRLDPEIYRYNIIVSKKIKSSTDFQRTMLLPSIRVQNKIIHYTV